MILPRQGDRIRVLLIAEMCNPAWTSVPLVGYNLAKALSQNPELDVTLVTQVRNKNYLQNDPIQKYARVHYINNEFVAYPFHLLSKMLRFSGVSWTIDTASMLPSYLIFEKLVQQQFGNQLAQGRFDIIHRITPLSRE